MLIARSGGRDNVMLNKKTIAPHITGDLHKISFSVDDFKRVREEGLLYIDKTKMIEDILTYAQ
jgi:hypothetical protein